MGKEKIEEKDVRLLRYAVEQAFDGAMRDGALTLLNRLVDSASEAANLEDDTWYEDYMLGCIDYIASVAYHGGILLKPITTEKEITGHIGDTILSWCEKGQKDDGGNEFRD